MGRGMQKGPLCPEPLSHQKKDGQVTRPSFFWDDTDLKKEKKYLNSLCRPSFFWYDNDSGH